MTTSKQLFSPGTVVATPGCLELLASSGVSPQELLARHLAGDWGDLDAEDAALNDEALRDGSRIFSAYLLKTGEKVWVITEAEHDGQRASTCCLRPEDY
jgi:hypothetical protein